MLSSARDPEAIKARVRQTLKNGAQIDLSTDPCKRFLRRHANTKVGLAVLFVDIDGSTKMSMTLSASKFATLLQVFSQEMTLLVSEYGGYTLKYVGDAVIALFPGEHDKRQAIKNAIACGKAMLDVVAHSMNPEFVAHRLPEIKVKVAIEYGELLVVLYGKSLERSHVDVVGPAISMAAKMLGLSRTGKIMAGQSVFENYGSDAAQMDSEVVETNPTVWTYLDERTGDNYKVHVIR